MVGVKAKYRIAVFALFLWAGLPIAGMAACRQALALGLDVSGSVDAWEYRLQLDGLANALMDPKVKEALLAMPTTPVELAVFEWSGRSAHRLLLDWTAIESEARLDAVVARLHNTERVAADPSTALGSAMLFGGVLLTQRRDCWSRTLDLSGDGTSNTGPRPREVKKDNQFAGITINALVIGADSPDIGDLLQSEIGELTSYFRSEVILGPDAFVEAALGFEDFEASMVRKLLRELEGMILSHLQD